MQSAFRSAAKARGALACAGLLGGFSASSIVAMADETRATIVAGSGAIGIGDGPATAATFMMPTQIAVDHASGKLYVTDTAAQRVRVIDRAGTVSTLAGGGAVNASGMWVTGGYADGPATAARFNRPSGIALAPNGAAYVADAGNHCIRLVSGGTVSTYAGDPKNAGTAGGVRTVARFVSPRGLVADKDGTLYVADWGAGVRKIAPDGTVSTLTFGGGVTVDRPTGVAIGRSGPFAALFVADARGLVRARLPGLDAERISAFASADDETHTKYPIASDVPLGVPHAVAAYDVGDVVYTDLRDSAVKFLRIALYERSLGKTPAEDAMLTGGGPDFDAGAPEFDAPMGVALDTDGTAYVADTGNRRIVRIAPLDRRVFVTDKTFKDLSFPAGSYRIAVLGSSYTWWGSLAFDSIAGLLATDLASGARGPARPPASVYFQVNLTGEFDLIDNVLSAGAADLVVLLLSPVDPQGLDKGPDAAAWGPIVGPRLQGSVAALRKAHVPMLLVLNPAPETLSPFESAYLFEGESAEPDTDYEREYEGLLSVVKPVDVPTLDLFPPFRAELAGPRHRPLFNTADHHYSPYGRAFVAKAIAEKLVELQPWGAK